MPCCNVAGHPVYSGQIGCTAGCMSSHPPHSHLSICFFHVLFYITNHASPITFQVEDQADNRAALQQVGATLSLIANEQQMFLTAGEGSTEEGEDLTKI